MSIRGYIEEQGEVVARTIAALGAEIADWSIAPHDHVLLVGSGSSLNALLVVRPELRRALGQAVDVVNPATLLREPRLLERAPLVVVLSQSGVSTTSIAVAEAVRERGSQALILTADPGSPIARLGLPVLSLPIGEEPIGPKTKGFAASVAACLVLAEKLGGASLPDFSADRLSDLATRASGHAAALCEEMGEIDSVLIAGSDRFLGIALEASLKISEISGVPAAGFEIEELLHGRLHGMTARSCGIVIAADDGERELAARVVTVMRQRGARIVVLNMTGESTPFDRFGAGGNQEPPFDAIAAIVPFQWLAVELASRRGMVPEDMRYPGLSGALAIKVRVP